jgi:hypothetical protein
VRLENSGMSPRLLASVVEGGYWNVNLGNLRTDDLRSRGGIDLDANLEIYVLGTDSAWRLAAEAPLPEYNGRTVGFERQAR